MNFDVQNRHLEKTLKIKLKVEEVHYKIINFKILYSLMINNLKINIPRKYYYIIVNRYANGVFTLAVDSAKLFQNATFLHS